MEAKLDKIADVLETNSGQIQKLETEIANEKECKSKKFLTMLLGSTIYFYTDNQ